jgi:molecular chaperone DnaJ
MGDVAATATRDYYEILGVAREADAGTIKRAFRSRARALHPDVSDAPDAAEKFGELSRAYGVLSKPSTRLLYDHFGYRGRGNGWFTPQGRRTARVRRRATPVAEVVVDELEVKRGVRRTVRWERKCRCAACGGAGAAPGAIAIGCPGCAGTGRRRLEAALSEGERLIQLESCRDCAGRGRLVSQRCSSCDGAGERTLRETDQVYVPPGAADGDRLRVQGDVAREVVLRVRVATLDQPAVRLVAALGLAVAVVFLILLLR